MAESDQPSHGTRKKAAAPPPMTGATSARSRCSFRISQEVSAINAQPWQAAPCRKRCSRVFSGSWERADRVVRAEPRALQRGGEMVFDPPRLRHEAAECPLGVGTRRVEQEARAIALGVYVDPLADGRARELEALANLGRASARKQTHARILLVCDEGREGGGRTDAEVADALDISIATVARVRRRCVKEGIEAALNRKPQRRRPVSVVLPQLPQRQNDRVLCRHLVRPLGLGGSRSVTTGILRAWTFPPCHSPRTGPSGW